MHLGGLQDELFQRDRPERRARQKLLFQKPHAMLESSSAEKSCTQLSLNILEESSLIPHGSNALPALDQPLLPRIPLR